MMPCNITARAKIIMRIQIRLVARRIRRAHPIEPSPIPLILSQGARSTFGVGRWNFARVKSDVSTETANS